MQLCVMAARYGQGSVYIDTEKKLSLVRLKEIASKRASTFNTVPPPLSNGGSQEGGFSYGGGDGYANEIQLGSNGGDERQSSAQHGVLSPTHLQYRNPDDVFQNVTVHSPTTTFELLAVMATIEDEIFLRNDEAEGSPLSKFPVRLLILDSIAAPARRDFGAGSAPQRAQIIFQCAQTLKRLADQLHLAIVVINQVGAVGYNHQGGEPGKNRAALGESWHHCLSTRIMMEYQNSLNHGAVNAQRSRGGEVRQATITKSNLAGQACVPFEVSALGVSDIST
jgi:RecA/RadA recombinase